MSRDVFIKVYADDKMVDEFEFNMFKNIIDAIDIQDYGVPDYKIDASVYYEIKYMGLIPKHVRIPEEDVENFENRAITLVRGAENKYKDSLASLTTEQLLDTEYVEKNYYTVYGYVEHKHNGRWFTAKAFEQMAAQLEKKHTEAYDRYFRLKNLSGSIEYYKLSSEQKDNILADVVTAKEDAEDLKWAIRACNTMEDIAEIERNKNDFKDIAMYIYVE